VTWPSPLNRRLVSWKKGREWLIFPSTSIRALVIANGYGVGFALARRPLGCGSEQRWFATRGSTIFGSCERLRRVEDL
jgi:hypothetical protein